MPPFAADRVPFQTPASCAPSLRPNVSFQSVAAVAVGFFTVKVPIRPPVQKPASAYSEVSSGFSSADATCTATPVAIRSAPAPRSGMNVLGFMTRNAIAVPGHSKIV
jgi:hypothetical protein